MVRIMGVDLPGERKTEFALTVVYGIGSTLARKIVEETKIPSEKRVNNLSEEEISKLQKAVESYPVEGDLRRMNTQSIRRLEEIGAYRGMRHKKGLPARGQRTRSNARTKRGKRQTIGAIKKEMRSQVAQKAQSEQKST
jgi:small subunit ribosomal protein S13